MLKTKIGQKSENTVGSMTPTLPASGLLGRGGHGEACRAHHDLDTSRHEGLGEALPPSYVETGYGKVTRQDEG